MAKTSISSSTPYASPADFLTLVDASVLGQLVRDDQSKASPTELATDPVLEMALLVGGGMLEAECAKADRYSPADLQALTGNSQALLKSIVCGIALQVLRDRRGIMEENTYPLYRNAMGWLEQLSDGEWIFAFAETAQAGLPVNVRMQPADFWNDLPTLNTNNVRQWGIRENRRGNGGALGAF